MNNKNTTISIVNTTGCVYCMEIESAKDVFDLIVKAFKEKKKVNLSFQNIEMLTTAFLNTAVGQLYKDFSEEYIRENLKVSEISNSGKLTLKRVIETAKIYYNNKKKIKND